MLLRSLRNQGRNLSRRQDISISGLKALLLLALSALAVSAQIGSPYPRGRGPGLPIPGRGRQSRTTTKEQPKVLPNFPGTLKRMDAKTIVLELDDYRILEFRRNDKTKFLKNGE